MNYAIITFTCTLYEYVTYKDYGNENIFSFSFNFFFFFFFFFLNGLLSSSHNIT